MKKVISSLILLMVGLVFSGCSIFSGGNSKYDSYAEYYNVPDGERCPFGVEINITHYDETFFNNPKVVELAYKNGYCYAWSDKGFLLIPLMAMVPKEYSKMGEKTLESMEAIGSAYGTLDRGKYKYDDSIKILNSSKDPDTFDFKIITTKKYGKDVEANINEELKKWKSIDTKKLNQDGVYVYRIVNPEDISTWEKIVELESRTHIDVVEWEKESYKSFFDHSAGDITIFFKSTIFTKDGIRIAKNPTRSSEEFKNVKAPEKLEYYLPASPDSFSKRKERLKKPSLEFEYSKDKAVFGKIPNNMMLIEDLKKKHLVVVKFNTTVAEFEKEYKK